MFKANRFIRRDCGIEMSRRRQRQHLGDLSSHLLRDIGMTIRVSDRHWRDR